jgi:hypothetical protein
MNTENIYFVKRLRLLNYLIARGFRDYEVIPDPTSHKGYNWFMFKRTPEFDEAVNEYFAQFKN